MSFFLYFVVYSSFLDENAVVSTLKLGRMHKQTGKKFVDPTAMSRQMREVSDF